MSSCYFYFSRDGLRVAITDGKSRIKFLEMKIKPEDLYGIFASYGAVPCQLEFNKLQHVDKKLEVQEFIFEVSEADISVAIEECKKVCPEGWIADTYYGSKGSFFEKDDKKLARTTLRRYT